MVGDHWLVLFCACMCWGVGGHAVAVEFQPMQAGKQPLKHGNLCVPMCLWLCLAEPPADGCEAPSSLRCCCCSRWHLSKDSSARAPSPPCRLLDRGAGQGACASLQVVLLTALMQFVTDYCSRFVVQVCVVCRFVCGWAGSWNGARVAESAAWQQSCLWGGLWGGVQTF